MNSLTQMGIHYVCKLGTIYKYPIQLDCSLFFLQILSFPFGVIFIALQTLNRQFEQYSEN